MNLASLFSVRRVLVAPLLFGLLGIVPLPRQVKAESSQEAKNTDAVSAETNVKAEKTTPLPPRTKAPIQSPASEQVAIEVRLIKMSVETIADLFKPSIPANGAAVNAELLEQIKELEKIKKAKVVGRINSMTESGLEAVYRDTTQCPIPSFTFNQQTSSFSPSGYEYKDIGLYLQYKPVVSADHQTIRMTLTFDYSDTAKPEMELSALNINDPARPKNVPVIQRNTITTTFSLADHKTVLLGIFDSFGPKMTGTDVKQKVLVLLTARVVDFAGQPVAR